MATAQPAELHSDAWIVFATGAQLAKAIRSGKVSARRALEVFVRRNELIGKELNAVVVLDLDRARQRADDADAAAARKEWWGPLHGVPMTIKESNDVAGLPTTVGEERFVGRIASHHEVMVERILAAGAVIWGKTNVAEALDDIQTFNPVYGTCNNPWDLSRSPSGSSGGAAAALAAGLTPIELGSDVGGSIRTPASFCGIYGHKPTYGLIPPFGPSSPLHAKEIAVRGPMARDAEDLRLVLECVAGPDSGTVGTGWQLDLPRPTKGRLSQYRVAVWADDPACRVDDDVRGVLLAFADALEARGALVDRQARPEFSPAENIDTYNKLTAANRVLSSGAESATSLREHRLAQETQGSIREAYRRFFEAFDILIVPSHCTPAFKHNQTPKPGRKLGLVVDGAEVTMKYFRAMWWACLTNVALLPSTCFPFGQGARTRLPVGINAVGPEWSDFITIDFARLVAAELGVGFVPPPLPFGAADGSPGRAKL